MHFMNIRLVLSLVLILVTCNLQAQEEPKTLSDSEISETIDSISNILEREYVFADIGLQISEHLKMKLSSGNYKGITDPFEFANVLTEDVRSINKDLHLRVNFNPQMITQQQNNITAADSLAYMEEQIKAGKRANHGFQEVKILEGNIGYLNLRGFYGVDEYSGATAEAAMNFLSNTDALIIDLRQNGGGSPSMIQLITSYLFDSNPVHLNNFYYRPLEEITQTWTLPYVPGNRIPDTDVYVLTSSRTFSAAEEFSYNLRNLERATLVGETTGGGAHPGGTRIATDRFTIWVPTGRAINPISKTNWEGTGVKPHIESKADDALDVAIVTALEKMLTNADEAHKYGIKWTLDGIKAEQTAHSITKDIMNQCIGHFGPRQIFMKDGSLYYQREGNPEYKLIPMKDDLFMIMEIPYFRLQTIKENNEVTALKGLYDSGRTDRNTRSVAKDAQP